MVSVSPRVLYLSMEIGISSDLHTYSGGLGVLAGDTLRSAADLDVPIVAVSLLYRNGYLKQSISPDGEQIESPDPWPIEKLLAPLDRSITVRLGNEDVHLSIWRYTLHGVNGWEVPVYFLDAGRDDNSPAMRELSNSLYGGDSKYRLAQEVILGLGGMKVLEALGLGEPETVHLNEGHAALLPLGLLQRELERAPEPFDDAVRRVRSRCIFTTHTPVSAGHDQFTMEQVEEILGTELAEILHRLGHREMLNMTSLALGLTRDINAVSMRHRHVCLDMFPGTPVLGITNGVHAQTWVADALGSLFDEYIPGWRRNPTLLRQTVVIPLERIWEAHIVAKQALFEALPHTDEPFQLDTFTIGFARRATGYKRATLVFSEVELLTELVEKHGPLQIVFAGKAHPRDAEGKRMIHEINQKARELKGKIRFVYVPNYDMHFGKLICSGVDLWLNNPIPPLEASGTSGMKAALNGVPSLSILDGWWVEGWVEGLTGWSIDAEHSARSLFDKLSHQILPLYHMDRGAFQAVMRGAISLNGSYFNTHRMVQEYVTLLYSSANRK